ncbi:MAG: polyketide synthase family protein [Planctomycetota bacterium]|nr:polyketide synthase family protein [Planctomycetota bacterium]
MTTFRRCAETIDGPDACASKRDGVERSIIALRAAIHALTLEHETLKRGATPPLRPRIVPNGLILLTDDHRGVARAVAADLRALGHPVLRVRHGVGDRNVEGVNLTAASAVAALLDRARSQGPLAAIVHVSPLSAEPEPGRFRSWDDPDDARALALLAQAGADDLKASAAGGGACLVVARPASADGCRDANDRLSRWVEISARTLNGVRVRGLELDTNGEPEVLAAEVVREVLGTAEATRNELPECRCRPTNRVESEAILLGAPDRAAWIHLAAALIDWLAEAPSVRLADLAFTLHDRQPEFPFRVGLVANSGPDLIDRLRLVISRIADPGCRAIQEFTGVYWYGPSEGTATRSRASVSWVHRFRRISREADPTSGTDAIPVELLCDWSGRDWLNHLAASRFARGATLRPHLLHAGRIVRKLDLTCSPTRGEDVRDNEEAEKPGNPELSHLLRDALGALDDALDLRRVILLRLLGEDRAMDRPAR